MDSYNNKLQIMFWGFIEVGWPEISDILGLRDTPYMYM
jgi:hypothetical protein